MKRAWQPLGDGIPEPWASEWGEDRLGIFSGFTLNGVIQRMRWIPSGHFVMGSPKAETGRRDDEVAHEVVLTEGFWLGETPVTQSLWEVVMNANPSRFRGRNHPVENVSYVDCGKFFDRVKLINSELELGLPTEAQWEDACRAGTSTATWRGNLTYASPEMIRATQLDTIAWYKGKGIGMTRQVMEMEANPWGLYDMLGNVWEWCLDGYARYQRGTIVNPKGPDHVANRVIRGGSWNNDARDVRAARRLACAPDIQRSHIGFRLCSKPAKAVNRPASNATEMVSNRVQVGNTQKR